MNAVIALGSNLGNSRETLRQALDAVAALPGTCVCAVSSLYRTAPVGYADQPDFLNAVATVETSLSAHALLGALLGIEAAMGRRRTFANAPRVVDLDLLLYQGVTLQSEELTLPHPRMHQRAFVLVPLAELFPQGEALGFAFGGFLQTLSRDGIGDPMPWE